MKPIGIDWNAIHAEYVSGGISLRKLADKHGVSRDALLRRSSAEKWTADREQARIKSVSKCIQITADSAADNAIIAARIKAKLLKRLEREIDAMPDNIGTEMHSDVLNMTYGGKDGSKLTKRTDGGKRFKLTDLTRAYRDLTEDIQMGSGATNDLLQSLLDLERGGSRG